MILSSFSFLSFAPSVHAQAPTGGTLVWSSAFSTGNFNQWTDVDEVNGGVATVTSAITYGGAAYSAYMYFLGPASGIESNVVRAYPDEVLTTGTGTANFEVNMWVYIPSTVDGNTVTFTDWVSLLTLYLNKGYWNYAPPITINTGADQELSMDLEMGTASAPGTYVYVYQADPITWSFNTWFEMTVVGNLVPGGDSTFTVYQNGAQIMTWSGVLPDTGTGLLGTGSVTYNGLTEMHIGLYCGGDQGLYAVYNDDVTVYNLAGTTSSDTTTPALDGSATGSYSSGTTFTVSSFSTTGSNDHIIVIVNDFNPTPVHVTSISDSSGKVTWQTSARFISASFDSGYMYLEEWYGIASAPLSSDTITIHLSGAEYHGNAIVFGVSGSSGFDSNSGLVRSAVDSPVTSDTAPSVSSVSTTDSPDFIFAFQANGQELGQSSGTINGYATTIIKELNGGNTQGLTVMYYVSSTAIDASCNFGAVVEAWGIGCDAMVAST